jgi:3'-phosphoadenosine 5'-phosphosulfate sulfotransferase (PAPS reductase)/FAD synthetase
MATTTVINDAIANVKSYADRYESVLISYSDGKDSRAVMDLCLRSFKRVEAFFMYLIPGLECVDVAMQQAEQKWGIKIRLYPHWNASRFISNGIYCHPSFRRDAIKEYKLRDVYVLAMSDTNTRLIMTGQKKSDSASRRWLMTIARNSDVVHPLADWNRFDVLNYLRLHNIPLPPSAGDTSGIDLTDRSLFWLHDTFPNDFRKLCQYFPFAEAAIWKRKFYSVPSPGGRP